MKIYLISHMFNQLCDKFHKLNLRRYFFLLKAQFLFYISAGFKFSFIPKSETASSISFANTSPDVPSVQCKNDTKLSDISSFLFIYHSTSDICSLLLISLASSAKIVKYLLSFTSETVFSFMYSANTCIGSFWTVLDRYCSFPGAFFTGVFKFPGANSKINSIRF